jgi:hypothetical protein
MDRWPTHQPDPGWQVMDHDALVNEIVRRAGNPDTRSLDAKLTAIRGTLSSLKERAISLLIAAQSQAGDPFLDRKLGQVEAIETLDPEGAESTLLEPGAGWSRDSTAVTQGRRVAPHQNILAIAVSATSTTTALDTLEKAVREAALHLERARADRDAQPPPTRPAAPRHAASPPDPFEEYDELAADVARSKHQFFRGNVQRWIDFLDRAPQFSELIRRELEERTVFKAWFEPYHLVAMGHGSRAIE